MHVAQMGMVRAKLSGIRFLRELSTMMHLHIQQLLHGDRKIANVHVTHFD
jgi:hypothetical protein